MKNYILARSYYTFAGVCVSHVVCESKNVNFVCFVPLAIFTLQDCIKGLGCTDAAHISQPTYPYHDYYGVGFQNGELLEI